jgi:hypothetical protein
MNEVQKMHDFEGRTIARPQICEYDKETINRGEPPQTSVDQSSHCDKVSEAKVSKLEQKDNIIRFIERSIQIFCESQIMVQKWQSSKSKWFESVIIQVNYHL